MCGRGVRVWICVDVEGGHEGFAREERGEICVVCAGDAVVFSFSVSVSLSLWWFWFWDDGPPGGIGYREEKAAYGKARILQDIAVVLGLGVEVCEEDLDDWGWVDWATVSVAGAAGSCRDGLLSDVEVIFGVFGYSSGWW